MERLEQALDPNRQNPNQRRDRQGNHIPTEESSEEMDEGNHNPDDGATTQSEEED
jgi:hypothetical protein